jgi:hypothetical protein
MALSGETAERAESAEGRARTSLVVAAGASVVGVAVAGTVSREVGGVILVLGWLVFVYALHSFGRAGSE